MTKPNRPNILLITSDQHRADCFGFEGRGIKTPHLDRMARQGTRFNAAITPNLVCQPARASILTGLMPHVHGVTDNMIDLDPAIGETGWARTLANHGYHSGFIGKAHFGVHPGATEWGAPESRSQSKDFPLDWHGPYMGFDHTELMILGHWHELLPCERPPAGQHFERWFWCNGSDGEAWRLWKEDFGPTPVAAQTWFSKLPAAWHSTTWVTDRTLSFLENANPNEPFCLWASYPDPHHPFDAPEPWSRLHHPDDIDISKTHTLDLDSRPWWHKAALTEQPSDPREHVRILRQTYSRMAPQTDQGLAQMTANYFGEIAFIDDGVGRILSKLCQLGLDKNTMVVFTSDHGVFLGDHGLYLIGPMAYEGCLRVGLLMQGPGISKNRAIEAPVSTVDLAATFYDWANVSTTNPMQSRSLMDVLTNPMATRDAAYSEWHLDTRRCGVELHLTTVRSQHAKLTKELISGDGELYDLANDPDENVNLFNDPDARVLKNALTELMERRPKGVH